MSVRVRCDAPQWERFKEFLQGYGELIAECFERPQGENPHYHAYFQLAGSSLDALKRARSRRFKLEDDMKGNKVASLSEMDKPEEYLEYLCKGEYAFKNQYKMYVSKSQPQVTVYNTTIFNKTIMEYHENFWKRHASDTPKKTKNFTKDLVLEFEDKYIKETSEYDEIEGEIVMPNQIQPEFLTEYILSKFCSEFKPCKMSLVIDIARLIWLRNKTHFTFVGHTLTYEQFVEKTTLRIFDSRPF